MKNHCKIKFKVVGVQVGVIRKRLEILGLEIFPDVKRI
jgi:hypothetical protein